MNYKIINGAVSYGADTILEEINFEIKEKDKIAIVGRNGSGKTTLLKALIDNDMLEQGVGESKFGVYKQGNPVIGYLKQIQFDDTNATLVEEIRKVYSNIIALEEKIRFLEEKLQISSDEKIIKEYTNALEKYKFLDGYTYKKEYETAIFKFGFTKDDMNKKINEFSGGQKTKIALIKLILSKPDILLLDEPTNHLDITTIEWLESYLKNYSKAIVIVSHDRMFLDKIVNKVYEIEYGAMTEYSGNYTSFEKQKRENYEKQLKDYEYQQKEIKRLKSIADRFRYKPTKAKMALSKLKKIEQMNLIDKPNKYDLKSFSTSFKLKEESGKLVLKVKNLEIGYNESIARVNFELYRGQKLGIIGANGKGKSTLLKTLMNYLNKQGGEFEYGYHVDKEYFDQQMEFEDVNKTVLEEFESEFPKLTITETRSALASFMFYSDDIEKEIKLLSGGEKVRLQLCKILKKGPNLLLLDEPTNHMDIIGKESLENLLKAYTGTLIVVSHDRYFINKIADSLLIFEEDKVTYFSGTYSEYMESKENNEALDKVEKEVKEKKSSNIEYLENKEKNRARTKIKRLENEIEIRENKIKSIQDEMLKEYVCTNYVKLNELQSQVQELEKEIEEKMTEWERLNLILEE
ncbi:MAG: ABC-F family ATP-binding cassette domain-containing protein [Clostridia bacterium]